MRKIILTGLILFFCYGSKSQKFDGGIIGGACISQVSGDDLAGFNSLGVVFGGFSNIKITNKSKLQIEMIYSQKDLMENHNMMGFLIKNLLSEL